MTSYLADVTLANVKVDQGQEKAQVLALDTDATFNRSPFLSPLRAKPAFTTTITMKKDRCSSRRLSKKPVTCIGLLSTCTLLFVLSSYDRRLSANLGCSSSSTASYRPQQALHPASQQHHQIRYKQDCELSYKESCIIPDVILLMSFPNSGTSYTLRMGQGISNFSIATNYHQELRNQTIEHVIPDIISPYKKNTSMPLPFRVLTKTHCTGYADRHALDISIDDFDKACRSIDVRGSSSTLEYSADIVTGAVHLFRSPFDNIVARMHLWIKRQKDLGKWTDAYATKYSESPSGLAAWCEDMDAVNRNEIERLLARQGVDSKLYQDLPCLTEQYRYIRWHTNAIHFMHRHNLPTLVLYYEWYTTKYFVIVSSLLKFLQLDAVNQPHEFYVGKTYTSLYTPSTTERMAKFMQAVASPECWELIQHYFVMESAATDEMLKQDDVGIAEPK